MTKLKMAEPKPVKPVTLIVGMISGRVSLFDGAEVELARLYGPINLRSSIMSFNFTDYYEPQMGPDLKRKFLSFANMIDPGTLARIKTQTHDLEKTMAHAQTFASRPINLDPGYICASKLVLASSKDRAHRIYLGNGVYAEITLVFYKKKFRPLETTYPDYRTTEYIEFFTEVRQLHMAAQSA